jgi:hypothetical protein
MLKFDFDSTLYVLENWSSLAHELVGNHNFQPEAVFLNVSKMTFPHISRHSRVRTGGEKKSSGFSSNIDKGTQLGFSSMTLYHTA